MISEKKTARPRYALILATTWCATSVIAFAGRPAEPAPADQSNPPLPAGLAGGRTQSVTINLINRLVEKSVLTKEEAAEMIKMAEADADAARKEVTETKTQVARTHELISQIPVIAPAPEVVPSLDAGFAAPDDSVRVTYIPEKVKAEMRDQIKQEVMAQARNENWANPRTLPDWLPRFRFNGDIRIRGEGNRYADGNDNTGAFPNFNAINTGAPFDVSGTVFSPQLNVDQNRQRIKLRARFGVDMDLEEGFTAGFRFGTGENNSPVTQNQGLGVANQGQGGNFSKYAAWIDRAFLKYDLPADSKVALSLTAGRFDNPFFSTSMIWVDGMGFDGLSAKAKYKINDRVTPFITVGAAPIFNTDLNFASNQPAKFKSTDKWLYAIQFGTDLDVNKDFKAKVAAAYYYFDHAEGQLSDPYTPITAQDAGNTDNTRPSFAQKGNTYMALRNIVPDVNNNFGTSNQFQYFGLATAFREVALTGRLECNRWEPFQISLTGEFVKNLAFERSIIDAKAVNNRGATLASGANGSFEGGDMGWTLGLQVGTAALAKRGDWNAHLTYRYLESDAVIDGFNDNDFGGGGTNVKGYTIGGQYALSSRVWLGLRWLSAQQIAGPPVKSDTIWFDINAKF